MAGSFVSRRLSEFVGVALFALALMWLISLASYSPADPVLFFTTGTGTPTNFGGRVGAFLAELSYQLLGYTAYLRAGRAGRDRLALLLVPGPRRGVHEARRRGPALRLRVVVSVAGLRHAPCRDARDAGGGLSRQGARVVPRRVPEQDRVDHPDPDPALPVHRPLDPVLVRPALRRALPDGARSLGGRSSTRCGRGRKSGGARSSARRCSRSISTRPGTKRATRAARTQRSCGRRHRPKTTTWPLPCRREPRRRPPRQSPRQKTKRRSPRAPPRSSAPPPLPSGRQRHAPLLQRSSGRRRR